jgi:tetratricopeptide (TPR) repeat protein
VQVGRQALADRYTYIPLTGLFIIAAWSAGDFCLQHRSLRPVAGAAAALLLAAMFAGTRNQLGYWKDGISLARRAIQVTAGNYVMHNNLGNALLIKGRQDEAISHYRRALQIKHDHTKAHNNLAVALAATSRLDEAVSHWRHALQVDPNYGEAHNNLGLALKAKGLTDEAISHWRRALQIEPDFAKAHNNLAISLAAMGRQDEAIRHFRRALQVDPDYAEAHYKLAGIFEAMGRLDEAIKHYRLAVELQPEYPAAINNLAWNLATACDPALRDPDEALSLARRACELTGHGKPEFLDTLAAAFAATGRFDEAEKTAEKAEKLAEAAGSEALAREIRSHLEMFRKGRSYIEKAPGDE